ncbi:hypothetical protein BD410DRAFT_143000 [Rickenella mellea]|uniref:Uncharacterized protein n=1 Tax=Rickenella mellea TaxID=50990 RepID=A0A4Y7Q8V0_9AGAM|nr:hypothetical protein BD410DRAFT_143000 [Rickenella mellea]
MDPSAPTNCRRRKVVLTWLNIGCTTVSTGIPDDRLCSLPIIDKFKVKYDRRLGENLRQYSFQRYHELSTYLDS